MDEKLKKMFDYQRFRGNERLSAMMQETRERYPAVLSEEELGLVNAAGTRVEEQLDEEPKTFQAPTL